MLGLAAGITGIGRGVYLVPLIILPGHGTAKEAAACSAFIIWVNPVAGLFARVQFNNIEFLTYLPSVVTVVLGGLAGTLMGAGRLQPQTMQMILGSILVVAILMLGKKIVMIA